MRHAIRIQPYLTPDLFQKLQAYAAAESVTVSAVINAALLDFFEEDRVEEALIVRRLNDVTQQVRRLRRDLETLAVGFGTFAWYSFLRAPTESDGTVVRRAEKQFSDFLTQVAQQFRQGVRFTRQVFPARAPSAAVATAADMGGREKEGRS